MKTPREIFGNLLVQIHDLILVLGHLILKNNVTIPQIPMAIGPTMIINIIHVLANVLDNKNCHLVHPPEHAPIVIELIIIQIDHIQTLCFTQIIPINPPLARLNKLFYLLITNRLLNLSLKSICIN